MWGKRGRSKRRTQTLINLITVVELLHRIIIREGPCLVVELVGILAEHFDGGNAVPLSVGVAPTATACSTALDPFFNMASSGGCQRGYQRLMATPESPMAQVVSVSVTTVKPCVASAYQNERGSVTARLNCVCAPSPQEAGNWTCGSFSPLSWATTAATERGHRRPVMSREWFGLMLLPPSRLQ
jgi:hypothetical protein